MSGGGHEIRFEHEPWARVPLWLIEAGASDNAIRVYVGLHRWRNSGDSRAHPSHARIAKYLGKGVATIRRGLAELETLGAITITRRPMVDDGAVVQNQTNIYTVIYSAPVSMDGGGSATSEQGGSATSEQGVVPPVSNKPDPSIQINKDQSPTPLVAVGAEVEEVPASMIEAQEIAGELAARVAVASGAKRKRPSKSSVDGIEKLIRIDEVPAAKVRRMLAWLHESGCDDAEFWKGNVLSGGKLREKWPTLAMKANASLTVGRSKVQRVQDTNQRLLYEANLRIAAEERDREDSRARGLEERARSELGANEWGYLAGQGGL